MTQLRFEHVSTNKYGHEITAYVTAKMRGYIVTVQADGVTSRYDFIDSFELALEYREALEKAYDAWSKEQARAENLYEATGDESGFKSAGQMWAGYMLLAHDARYLRWTLPFTPEEEGGLLDDMQATMDAASGRYGY